MNRSGYNECKTIVELNESILGTGIIRDLRVQAMYARPGVPLPNEDKLKLMFAQSEVLMSVAKSNTDFFGPVRHLVFSFENSDTMFFPFQKERTLVIQILRPYDQEKIAETIRHHLK